MKSAVNSTRSFPKTPLLAASACIWHQDKVLLVLGATPPKENLWSLPGGLVELGETLQQAAERELLEETGLTAKSLALADWIEIIKPDGGHIKYHYVIALFVGNLSHGSLAPGDDAKDARWFELDHLCQLAMTKGTADLIHKVYAERFSDNS